MFGVMRLTLDDDEESMRGDDDFFSVASTMPFVALIPKDVTPWLTAFNAYSICTSLPLGEKVVSEKEYRSAMTVRNCMSEKD